jgi:hypothetical protein
MNEGENHNNEKSKGGGREACQKPLMRKSKGKRHKRKATENNEANDMQHRST